MRRGERPISRKSAACARRAKNAVAKSAAGSDAESGAAPGSAADAAPSVPPAVVAGSAAVQVAVWPKTRLRSASPRCISTDPGAPQSGPEARDRRAVNTPETCATVAASSTVTRTKAALKISTSEDDGEMALEIAHRMDLATRFATPPSPAQRQAAHRADRAACASASWSPNHRRSRRSTARILAASLRFAKSKEPKGLARKPPHFWSWK
mmetsp:Transcript_8664/g.30373  ORF Transcript_8664/g.30373 Transcript_8664/m.30373 type:complete len:210 (+) Transcript_8664:377-1006(+)